MIQLYSLRRAPRAFLTGITRVKRVLDPLSSPKTHTLHAISAAGIDDGEAF